MNEFDAYTDRVVRSDDGAYRWYYDMDMYRNRSMLVTLEKVNLFTFLGASVGGALLIRLVEGDAAFARGVLLIGLGIGALMALLYVIGFFIAARIRRGSYRLHFAMREDGIELAWSDRLREGFETGRKAMIAAGSAAGSRAVRGRWRPTLDEVSRIPFSQVLRYKSHPRWDMIDMSVPGGKFQAYVGSGDFDFVERYILDRVPERARRAHR